MANRMKVLVVYDGSECADAALDDLRRAGLPSDSQIKVLSVVESWLPPPSGLEIIEHIDRDQEYLALARRGGIRLVSMEPGWDVKSESGAGSPATVIIEKADEWGADLIVIGSHGRMALGQFFFGSLSQMVLHEARRSVRVARGRIEEPDTPVRLIIGVDDSKGAEAAVEAVAARKWPAGSEARIVNATWATPQTSSHRMVSPIAKWILEENVRVKKTILESILFALALAVGLTPEFLPMITTVTLGRGALHMGRQKVIVKHLEAIQNFGSIDVLCSDKTGTLTSGEMTLDRHVDPLGDPADRVLLLGCINGSYESGVKNPINVAILKHDPLDIGAYRKVDEVPFDFERRRLSVVAETKGEILLITKGAPESVLTCCSQFEVNGQTRPLDNDMRAKCQAIYDGLSSTGYRVLAVASRPVPQQEVYRVADEKDLALAGFLAFSDPPLADAAESIKALRLDGVRVKILTGDSELVAQHICSQVGLDAKHIALGEELDRISDIALAAVAEKTIVFARVSPAQKHRIILALKGRGHVVGYLGDGINDAPSLHAADVGISVATAVDVAKEAADIILLERSLRVLHQGIIEGRKAFGNVMKYLLMGTSSNFGNMFSMAAAAAFLPFLPMLPTQILLNNFLYDLAQITIPTDNVDASYIDKPRRWDIKMIRDFMIYIGPISSIYDFLTFYALLKIFHASEALFHTGWFVESLATQTLVLFVIRTAGNPFRSRPSLPLAITTMLIVLLGIVLPVSPLARVFGFTPLPAMFFLFLSGMVITYLFLVEIVKRRLMRRRRIHLRPSRLR